MSDDPHPRAIVGFGISKRQQDSRLGIPLTIDMKTPKLHLGLSFRLEADEFRKYLMVTSSVLALALTSDLDGELLHYDYERGKGNYPEAHVQVCASSTSWEEVKRLDGQPRVLKRLHLPVGPRRFRPSLEDLIEFLVIEKLVAGRPGWEKVVQSGRESFRKKQLRAAVRRDPETALQALKDEGHI